MKHSVHDFVGIFIYKKHHRKIVAITLYTENEVLKII